MICIDSDNIGIFIIQLSKIACHLLGVGLAPVNANKRRRDVCLLVKVGQTEAIEMEELVDDGGLVLGAETSAEVVLGLGPIAVDSVNEGRN